MSALRIIYLIFSIFIASSILTSCAGGDKGQPSEEKKKTKAKKRCKMKSCHVRMVHMHEGKEVKGKRGWFLKACFFFNKNPKYGEGMKKDQRDPYQGRRK